jgi:hypothetical protein
MVDPKYRADRRWMKMGFRCPNVATVASEKGPRGAPRQAANFKRPQSHPEMYMLRDYYPILRKMTSENMQQRRV